MSVPTSEHSSEHILSTERLEALVDGIFAFAMTLLVLSIDLPASIPTASANQAILKYLIDLMPRLGSYVIVFLILGMLWTRIRGRSISSNTSIQIFSGST